MIFTFYSYKGGVGRSMAMAAIAHLLARRGLRVLAIDFDLEAPGLERYFFDAERSRAVRAQRGLIDLVKAYRQALASEAAFAAGEFKRWQSYCVTAVHVAGSLGGSVDLMTAGRREPEAAKRDYALAVRSFDWQDFFTNWKGDLFFDWLRRQLLDPATGYHVVLVDSRTGVTEMGGVCAYQLADTAVLLCAPNFQNLDGTVDVVRDFRSDAVRALRRGRPLEILAIPARLEMNHPRRAEFLRVFKEELGVEGLPCVLAAAGLDYEKLALAYVPQFAVAERLVGDPQSEGGDSAPLDVYERLTDALTLLAPNDSPLGAQRDAALQRLTGGGAATRPELLADVTRSSAGYDAFLDYDHADADLVRQLQARLEAAGFSVFRDMSALEPGSAWGPAIEHALEYSHALLVCFGHPTHDESRARTIALARRRGMRLVPLLLPGADPAALASFDLSRSQAVDLGAWPEAAADEALLRAMASAPDSAVPAPVPARDPYPGAAPYREDDAAFFFGRDGELEQLLAAVRDHDVVLVRGAAQVGKTSLLQAGLVPRLRRLAAEPGPLQLGAIATVDLGAGTEARWPGWGEGADGGGGPPRLLVVDGIDTFPAAGDPAARAARLEELARVIRDGGGSCKLVLAARDVLEPEEDRLLDAMLGGRRVTVVRIEPLAGSALRRAVEEPAKRAGHLLEPGLAERLVESAGSARGAIAQIQLALARIWPERRRGWLTNKSLDAAGHLGGIVQSRRAEVLGKLSAEEQAAAHVLFSRLVTLSSAYDLVAASQPWAPLATVPSIARLDAVALRDRLAASGTIDLYRADTPGAQGGGRGPVHVALTRPDPAVYFGEGRAEADLRFLMWREPLSAQAIRWCAGDTEALLRGAAVAEAQEWLARARDRLTAREAEFISESVAAHERAAAAAEEHARRLARSNRRLKILSWIAILLLVGAAFAAFTATRYAALAQEKELLAKEKELFAKADAEDARAEYKRSMDAVAAAKEAVSAARLTEEARKSALAADTKKDRQRASQLLSEASVKRTAAEQSVQRLEPACPDGRRVYLHVADEADRAGARRVATELEKRGWVVPGIQLVREAPRTTDVRYFRASDEASALDLKEALAAASVRQVEVKRIAGYESSSTMRPCHYEVWFAAGTLAAIPAAMAR